MRLVMHIGYYKCGSTALQHRLCAAHDELLASGVLYPVTARAVNGSHGGLPFSLLNEVGMQVPDWYLRSVDHDVPSFDDLVADLRAEIDETGAETIVISSEEFVRFGSELAPAHLVDRVADVLSADDVTIVAYLRRPDTYVVSWYGQMLKLGHLVPTLRRLVNRWITSGTSIHVDFARGLEPWYRRFGRDKVTIRDYAAMVGGDVVDDFASVAGFAVPEVDSDQLRINTSLPAALYETLRRQNLITQDPGFVAMRQRAFEQMSMSPVWNRITEAKVELLGADGREQLIDAVTPMAEKLAEWSGHESSTFFGDLEAMREPTVGAVTPAESHDRFGAYLQTAIQQELVNDISSLRRACDELRAAHEVPPDD